jgi:hypothetical protein
MSRRFAGIFNGYGASREREPVFSILAGTID